MAPVSHPLPEIEIVPGETGIARDEKTGEWSPTPDAANQGFVGAPVPEDAFKSVQRER